ncbi:MULTISPECIES: hypothetical protein [Gemmobacter]|jgi:uncharacterized protein YjiS (DUF1127 family)|uniref:DUF1127 domain-containing protein n=2 Tax=Gemmobacter TaxID=204456 RepID=A0A2T6BBA6_9RHOB|nr:MULTISPECIES: hypothetical protein [Gemmobacter]PTX53333.1 hypothetical protein C8N34_101248 [Gemmobacter caeni]TWJ05444.1 hypothetical protein IQ03_00246 [Gemmobacter caeni]GHC15980.1 hypothetical protein GCM10007291_12860 [Gemmobacter nanjingensis]
MTNLIARLKSAAEKRARYIETRNEIARLPQDVALDLGLFPGDAHRIAHQAVYGRG